MEWQPIEKAPRDGRLILASNRGANEISGMYCAYWSDEWGGWMYTMNRRCPDVAYWQPLPPPPEK